ncbi:hypothetical protein BGX27_003719 [Mortierella sp. AM989]|nr:hypothetical protein BGX27_003719 [Mortierella sp. AM989]
MHFRNSEWGPETNDATLDRYRDLPCPLGGTMGDLFDATPKGLTSKIFLEEKLFKTWHYSRTVLIGDACHKFHPAGAQGARNAICDAVVLANCIYSMPDDSPESIENAFKEYYRQEYPHAEVAYKGSVMMSKLLNGQNWYERILRHVVLNYTPAWIIRKIGTEANMYRPQIAWLPLIENRGIGPVSPQEFI